MLESVLFNEYLKIAVKLAPFKVHFHVVPEVKAKVGKYLQEVKC